MAELVKKGRADFIAEVLLIAIGPFPNVGEKEADARKVGGIGFFVDRRTFKKPEFVAHELMIEGAMAGFFLHRNRQ